MNKETAGDQVLRQKHRKLLQYDGLGSRCVRMDQYTEEFPPRQVAVGFSRSAAGARAPIASIVSSVSHTVAPPSVELFRDRRYRHLRIISAANYENALSNAIGLIMNHDETSMRLCIGPNEMQILSISVRCLTIYTEGGDDIEMVPALSRLGEKTALGILGGAKLNDLELEKFAPDNGRWKFLLRHRIALQVTSLPSDI